MRMNGKQLTTRGKEKVVIRGEKTKYGYDIDRRKRTVYQDEETRKYYVKKEGEFIEVYRNTFTFGNVKEAEL